MLVLLFVLRTLYMPTPYQTSNGSPFCAHSAFCPPSPSDVNSAPVRPGRITNLSSHPHAYHHEGDDGGRAPPGLQRWSHQEKTDLIHQAEPKSVPVQANGHQRAGDGYISVVGSGEETSIGNRARPDAVPEGGVDADV
ncbi:hypothetical protein J3458_000619 [Metarhizium acridum]|uniref:uncharacterized protein n=1 Tax=Metarhizium acridum TaxID=92637 RepID=UPI001C6CBB7B|nr:hypothetical protein J3458_000619 [Metarhizium acridum]